MKIVHSHPRVAFRKGQIAVAPESGGAGASFGLQKDGDVVGTGSNGYGAMRIIQSWYNIVSLFNGPFAVNKNGIVSRAMHATYANHGVGGWREVVDVVGNYDIQYGLNPDGTLVYTYTRTDVTSRGWTDIRVPY